MAYEQRDNEIVLFPNDKKQSDKDPNAKGQGMVNGVEVWVSAWTNTSKNGLKYQKLKVTPKDDSGQGDQRPADDDIPW